MFMGSRFGAGPFCIGAALGLPAPLIFANAKDKSKRIYDKCTLCQSPLFLLYIFV
jgi:predicted LPLAT superfamily acyltransferase